MYVSKYAIAKLNYTQIILNCIELILQSISNVVQFVANSKSSLIEEYYIFKKIYLMNIKIIEIFLGIGFIYEYMNFNFS